MRVCIVIKVGTDGLISRIDEYFDPAEIAPLLRTEAKVRHDTEMHDDDSGNTARDPDTAGVWNLAPDRSAVTFKIKNFWGLLNVKGQFTEFSGDGQLTGKGACSAASISASRRCAPVSLAATSICARPTSSMSNVSPRSASSSPRCSRKPERPLICGPASPSKASPRQCRCPSPSPSSTTARSGYPAKPRSIDPSSTWAGTSSA